MTEEQIRAMAEQARVSRIMTEISAVDKKLQKCRAVKGTLSGCQTSLDGELEEWKSVRTNLESDPRYVQIVTTDVFEGEMADKLAAYMNTVDTDINTGISDTAAMAGELQAQLGALEAYEARLMAQRASLVSQL